MGMAINVVRGHGGFRDVSILLRIESKLGRPETSLTWLSAGEGGENNV